MEDPGTCGPMVPSVSWHARQRAWNGETVASEDRQGEGEGGQDLDGPALESACTSTLGSSSAPGMGAESIVNVNRGENGTEHGRENEGRMVRGNPS